MRHADHEREYPETIDATARKDIGDLRLEASRSALEIGKAQGGVEALKMRVEALENRRNDLGPAPGLDDGDEDINWKALAQSNEKLAYDWMNNAQKTEKERDAMRLALEAVASYGHEEAECPAYFNKEHECKCFVGIAKNAITGEESK